MKKVRSKKRKFFNRKKKLIANRLKIILIFFGIFSLVFFGAFKVLKLFFSVKYIYADDTVLYDKESIINACEIKNGEILFLVNSDIAAFKVCKSLPYIESAKIKKCLPDVIKIEVQSAKPKFNLSNGEDYFIVSEKNKLLEKRKEKMPEIPNILGLKFFISENGHLIYENKHLKESIDILFECFRNNGLFNLNEVNASNENNLILEYGSKLKIIFGDENDIEYKVATVKEIITNKIKSSEKGTLDLSKLSENNKSYFTSKRIEKIKEEGF